MKTTSFIFSSALIVLTISSSFINNKKDKKPQDPVYNKTADFHDLNHFSDLQEAFNADQGNIRFVALLSASCGYCIKGYRFMRKILEEVPDERLKMYVVWEPMLSGDTRALSEKMSLKGDDPRIVYQSWDPDQITGKKWTSLMSKERSHEFNTEYGTPAWDVYFLYNEESLWKNPEPTVPDYWQHQGAGISELNLNYDKLKAKVVEMLKNLD